MSVKKQKDGKYLVTVDKKGMKRVRKSFLSRKDAEAFERDYIVRHSGQVANANVQLTNSTYPQDMRVLTELVGLWFKYHGYNLGDGEKRQRVLLDLARALGDPIAAKLTPELFVDYRFNKLRAGLSDKSMNNRHGYLNGRVTYEFTKSKRTRTIPVDTAFYKQLLAFAIGKNPEDRVFTNCIGAFRRAVLRAGIELPKGQNTHILRHSFASHFVMNGGNILTLQKILGHADITMTMRYAHLTPDHFQDAIKFNPMA